MMHLKKPVIVADVIGEVVVKVSAAFNEGKDPSNHVEIKYYHENPTQWSNRLDEKTKAGVSKFHAIVLFHDFPEDRNGEYFDINIPVLGICCLTKPEYLSDKRYTLNFRPVLYPLYQLFLKFLAQHPAIVGNDPNNIQHRKYDRLYWGSTDGKQSNDYLDAIELQNLKLTLKQFC